jgi:hypothetical protein
MIRVDQFENLPLRPWRHPPALTWAAVPVFLLAMGVDAGARATETASTPDAAAQARKQLANPIVDPAAALADQALVTALRKGGFVLYLRHTETGAITEQCNVSNLSPTGAKVARDLGDQLKRLRIPVGRVVSSPVCRVQETAKLLGVGEVELSDDLAQAVKAPAADLYTARMRQLAAAPREGTNTIAVSHMHGGVPRYQTIELEFGEIIVFRPDGASGITPVARVRAEDWQTLAATDNGSRQP